VQINGTLGVEFFRTKKAPLRDTDTGWRKFTENDLPFGGGGKGGTRRPGSLITGSGFEKNKAQLLTAKGFSGKNTWWWRVNANQRTVNQEGGTSSTPTKGGGGIEEASPARGLLQDL